MKQFFLAISPVVGKKSDTETTEDLKKFFEKNYEQRPFPMYQMQICLGLEACDAKTWMIETVPNATQHDNFPERFLIGSPRDKVRFCMYKRGCDFCWLCNTDFVGMES